MLLDVPGHLVIVWWYLWNALLESSIALALILSYHKISMRYQDNFIHCCFSYISLSFWVTLTHWGRVTHICVSKVTIIVSDNGLSPGRRQAIIWNNAGILLIGTLGTNFNEILIEILTFSFKKMRLKVSSAKRQPLCRGLNVLMNYGRHDHTFQFL